MTLKLTQSNHLSKHHHHELIRKTQLKSLHNRLYGQSSHISKLFIIINLFNRK